MERQTKQGDITMLEWDWKTTPSWNEVLDAIYRIQEGGLKPQIIDVDTRSDQNAVILAPITFDHTRAQEYYDNQEQYFLPF